MDLHLKLLDKISTRDDLHGFLESAPVREVLEGHLRAERSDARRRILDNLALLWLAHAEQMSHQEIARITGYRVGSIRPLLSQARRRLAAAVRTLTRSA
jgi:DNA-directed RNA polymerase specialized sigma24 family protein